MCISIIIPVYNVAAYLPRCLDSLVNQTYRDIEIICVNDGSTDDSLRVLEEYAGKDARIQVISRENRGVSATRNEGLDRAQGEWVMFVDSDDWIESDTCRQALETVRSIQADMVLWAYTREYPHQSLPKIYFPSKRVWDKDMADLHRRMVGPVGKELSRPDTMDAWGTIWGKLYRRDCMENPVPVRFVDTKQIGSAEDVLFNVEYMGRVSKAVYLPLALYHYRKEAGFTSRHNPRLPQQWNTLYREMEEVLIRQHRDTDFREAYQNRIALGLIGLGLNELFARHSMPETQKRISDLLKRPVYRTAIREMPMRYLPFHWRLFFTFAKYNFTTGVMGLLMVIQKMIQR